jgi:hypothetical protein
MLQNAEWKRAAEEKARTILEEESAVRRLGARKQVETVTVSEPESFGTFPPRMRLKVRVAYNNGSEECSYYFPDTCLLWPTGC